jgi:CheY-like chemotaxis protein
MQDDIGKNFKFSLSLIDNDGVFVYVDKLLLEIFEINEILNIKDNNILYDIYNTTKEKIFIKTLPSNNRMSYKIIFNISENIIFLSIIDISIMVDEYYLLNLSLYNSNNSQLPILWIDDLGKIMFANKSAKEIINQDDLINKYIYKITTDITKKNWDDLWNNLNIDETKTEIINFYNKEKDILFVLEIICKKISFYDRLYCNIIIKDITELIETNSRLCKEKIKAQESERLKNAFLSNISHEIRTPMNAIIGFSDILKEYINDELKEYTDIISDNVYYLLSLIDNIITISRLDSEEVKINETTFDILEVLKDIKFIYKSKVKNKNLSLCINNNKKCTISSDKYIIEECIKILVDNAIKFTYNGKIKIGYNIENEKITIFVEDSGIGFENKYKEVIFDRFKQIDKQITGSGLGLSIFKMYVNLLNGTCDVKSTFNEGSIFSFTINLKNNKVVIEKKYKNLKKIKIMVVEDLEVNQLMINDMLLPYKINIIQAMNGKECIEKFKENVDIELILMDLEMPEMDGYEATKILRKIDKVIPIIAQTAYTQKENREKAKKIGFNDFITKPINKNEIINIIQKYLKK